MKVKHVKTLYLVFYLQVITDAYDKKKAVLEICFGKRTTESVVETFKNICTVVVHCCSLHKRCFCKCF